MTCGCDNPNDTGYKVTAICKFPHYTGNVMIQQTGSRFSRPKVFKPPAFPTIPRKQITREKVVSTEETSPVHSSWRGGKRQQFAAILLANRAGSRYQKSTHRESDGKIDLAFCKDLDLNIRNLETTSPLQTKAMWIQNQAPNLEPFLLAPQVLKPSVYTSYNKICMTPLTTCYSRSGYPEWKNQWAAPLLVSVILSHYFC